MSNRFSHALSLERSERHSAVACSRRRMLTAKRSLCAAVLALVVVMLPARGDAQGARDALPDKLRPETRTAIAALVDSLERERLPGDALYDKAAEGVLKGADDRRILVAVQSLAGRLREVRRVLGPDADRAALLAGASALFAGVPTTHIARVAEAQRGRASSLEQSLSVLAALVSHGIPSERATTEIGRLAARGADDRHLEWLRATVEREIRSGETPATSLERGLEDVLRRLRPPPG